MLSWIELNTAGDDVVILLGDINASPSSVTYNTIVEGGFVSSFRAKNGEEPKITSHNWMNAPFKDSDSPGTFDYILYISHNL